MAFGRWLLLQSSPTKMFTGVLITLLSINQNQRDSFTIAIFYFTLIIFYKQLGSGFSPRSCLCFQGFRGPKLFNGYLVVWPSNPYLKGIPNRYLWLVILKFSQKCFWDSWILVYCRFNSYCTLIAKEKLHFSLICSFYCCLVKRGWALEVA